MTPPAAAPLHADVPVDMFHSSPRLRHLVRLLRPLPRGLGEEILAGVAVIDGLVRHRRFRQAHRWAGAQPGARDPAWRLALALLANHGRFCAEEALLGVPTTMAPSPDVALEGGDRLPGPGFETGAILLGFHLGPPRIWFHLRTLGYAVRLAGALVTSSHDPRWRDAIDRGDVLHLPDGAPTARLPGLYQIRDVVRGGGHVYLAADGPFGREAFRIDLPGGPLVVRLGWLALRRLTRAPTFPLLVHREGRRRVIVVHPPLPAPVADLETDAAQCRAALAPLIEGYVRRYPTQCRYLAFPPWLTNPPRDGEALDSVSSAT